MEKINPVGKKISFDEIVSQYNSLLDDARKLDFFVRDTDLQKEMINRISQYNLHIKSFKFQVNKHGDEKTANLFFHFQCVLNATMSALSVWISLKESDHNKAWNNLIDAQEYLSYALRVSDNGYGIEEFRERLQQIEKVIFPGFPLYNSLGLVVKGGVCSVCEKPLELCEHIEDEIYSGTVCKRIRITDLEINHSAIVTNPKDRRCIITEFEFSPGKIHDYMTLRFLRDKENHDKENGTAMSGVLYNMNDLDLY